MLKEFFAVKFVADVSQTIGIFIQIWLVYLLNIAGEHNLSAFSGTGNNGFYLMRCQVLCFINDEICFLKASTSDICEWGYFQLLGS